MLNHNRKLGFGQSPLANELMGKSNVLIVDACDDLTKRIRRIDRQLNKLEASSPKYVSLSNTRAKLVLTFIELSHLHYNHDRTFIPGSIVRYRKD